MTVLQKQDLKLFVYMYKHGHTWLVSVLTNEINSGKEDIKNYSVLGIGWIGQSTK